MTNGKAGALSDVVIVSQMVKAVGEARVEKVTELVNQIILEVITAESELSTIVNWYWHKGKGIF